MNVLKSEIKKLVAHEVGVRMDDAREALRSEQSVLEGKQAGFNEGSRVVEALSASVDKELEEEKLTVEESKKVKRYLTRAVHALQNMAQQVGNLRIATHGKVQGVEHGIALLKGIIDDEEKKAQLRVAERAEASETGEDDGRPVGSGKSLKEQRLAEEQVGAAVEPPPPAQEPAGEAPSANNA